MKSKKLLAEILSAAMVLGTMVFPAFADGEATTLPTADENGVITLTENVTLNGSVDINNSIDLNAHSLTINGITSIIKNGIIKNGTIKVAKNANSSETMLRIGDYSNQSLEVEMKDVMIEATEDYTAPCGLLGIYQESKLTLNDVTINVGSNDGVAVIYGNDQKADLVANKINIIAANQNKLIYGVKDADIKNMTFEGKINKDLFSVVGGKVENSTFTYTNAENETSRSIVSDAGLEKELTFINTKIENAPTFTKDAINNTNESSKVVADEHSAVNDTKMTGFGGIASAVAKIGDKYFDTLEAAVNAAQNGDTVKLLSDTEESVKITAGKELTLDLNGHKLTNAAGKHTIENYGTLTVRDTSDDKTAAVDNVTNGKSPLVNYEGGNVTLDGGSFVRSLENSKVGSTADCNSCYTIKNWGVMTINSGVTVENGSNNERGSSAIGNGYYNGTNFDGHSGVTAESVNVKLTINGGTFVGGLHTIKNDDRAELEVNGGTFSNPANYSIFNVNKAVINNGTFTGGHYGTAYNRFYAGGMNAGELTIKGGEFNGKIIVYNPTEAATLISGGTFSTDVSAYTAPGFTAKKVGDKWIVDNSATELTLGFKKTTTDERVYDIIVTAVDAAMINRLNTAELTFNLTATNEADSTVTYEILPVTDITVTPDNENTNLYMFNFNGKDGVTDTANEITVGQVRFEGYTKNSATITFKTDMANSFVTATTKDGENLVTYFGSEAGLTADNVNKIDGVEFAVPTNKLTVNITFPNAIADQVADYQDMKVVISGSDLAENLVYKLGTGEGATALEGGAYKLVVDGKLTENTAYTVTVSGAGYRTARYTVTMTVDKTLNFWNNVKDTPAVVEEGKDASKKSVTFLAGDIVKDGKINIYDLSAVVSYFGTVNNVNVASEYAKYDLNRDGKIDSKDVAYVLVSWGK